MDIEGMMLDVRSEWMKKCPSRVGEKGKSGVSVRHQLRLGQRKRKRQRFEVGVTY